MRAGSLRAVACARSPHIARRDRRVAHRTCCVAYDAPYATRAVSHAALCTAHGTQSAARDERRVATSGKTKEPPTHRQRRAGLQRKAA
ncbi:hypothetical protein WS71_11970 [Burkholderia mayonis]|uniref:Uncharacterized protein n=1 Tax=Burkholderia mayonis TaxID=1385591 RepID=A0A1B4FWA4_9BURK|nr:hypothetical protein WS71_11970 [Burkholderia mayonis]KVE55438.1 hypothetical protein WS71_03065 [Burkholderia mayonis]